MAKNSLRCKRYGFTLVEILIVVVILGVLAAIVIPSFANASAQSQQAAFVSCLKTFVEAARYYEAKTGQFPADGSSGVCPLGFDKYIDKARWERPTPIGGVWDSQLNEHSLRSTLGVHFYPDNQGNPGDAFMQEVDGMIDDGNLSTGIFRKVASDRYYIIVAP